MDINNNKNDIHIAEVINHKDGSATVTVECSQEVYGKVFGYGFVALLTKGLNLDADEDA